jgi:uncharacterized protein YjbJ (UPF0337 family)
VCASHENSPCESPERPENSHSSLEYRAYANNWTKVQKRCRAKFRQFAIDSAEEARINGRIKALKEETAGSAPILLILGVHISNEEILVNPRKYRGCDGSASWQARCTTTQWRSQESAETSCSRTCAKDKMKNEYITDQLIPNLFFVLKKWDSLNSYREANQMNWDELEGKWKQYKGQVREKWGKLTDDDIHVIAGRREQLVGRLQERYGIAKQEASKQADEFLKALTEEPVEKERAKAAGQRGF